MKSSKYVYLTIIAEEEMAKLIMLPIINKCGDIVDFLNDKSKNPFYDHKTKQRLISTFGFSDKNYSQLEKKKQNCLYFGIDKQGESEYIGKLITKKEINDEIIFCFLTYENLLNNILKNGGLSETGKKMFLILVGSLIQTFENIDGIYTKLDKKRKEKNKQLKTPIEIEKYHLDNFIRNSYEWIDYVVIFLEKEYGPEKTKEHLRKFLKLDRKQLIEYLFSIIKNNKP